MPTNTRYETLPNSNMLQYLDALSRLRHEITLQKSHLRPFCEEYNALAEMMAAIDQHQVRWTGNPQHYWAGPNNSSQ